MKIVINKCYGGFSMSKLVFDELEIEYNDYGFLPDNIDRTSKKLIKAIEKIGLKESSGEYAKLSIIEIPDNIDWFISNFDGMESVHENHEVWN